MGQSIGSIADPPQPDSKSDAPSSRERREPDLVAKPIELGWVRELRATDEQLDEFLFRRNIP